LSPFCRGFLFLEGFWGRGVLGYECCREGFPRELCSLYDRLLGGLFFDKRDCVNSDGRRLLEKILGILARERRVSRRRLKRVRSNPCLDAIAKLASDTFYACDPFERYYVSRGLYALFG